MDISNLSSIAFISLLAAMSPGPDFVVVTKNCLSGTFKAGLLTALGVSSALLIHISYCLFGLAIVIQQSPVVFHILQYLGAAYLFYLGIMLFKEKILTESLVEKNNEKKRNAFLSGFLCNLLNPKATLFVLSLFTQFIDPSMSFFGKAAIGSMISCIGLLWFILLSYLITHRLLQKHFARFQLIITKVMGIALCILAVYIAFF